MEMEQKIDPNWISSSDELNSGFNNWKLEEVHDFLLYISWKKVLPRGRIRWFG